MANTKSLNNFMEALNNNNVRTQNLFEMRVYVPTAADGIVLPSWITRDDLNNYLSGKFTFYGQGFQLPGRSFEYANVGFKGFTVPVPTVMKMTQEHTVTINADINGNMRRAFLAWQAITMNPTIASGEGYFEGNRHLKNSGKIQILLLDPIYGNPDNIVDVYTLYGITISDVGTMTFSNTGSDIATFDVTFKSQYWQYGPSDNVFGGIRPSPIRAGVDSQFLNVR